MCSVVSIAGSLVTLWDETHPGSQALLLIFCQCDSTLKLLKVSFYERVIVLLFLYFAVFVFLFL